MSSTQGSSEDDVIPKQDLPEKRVRKVRKRKVAFDEPGSQDEKRQSRRKKLTSVDEVDEIEPVKEGPEPMKIVDDKADKNREMKGDFENKEEAISQEVLFKASDVKMEEDMMVQEPQAVKTETEVLEESGKKGVNVTPRKKGDEPVVRQNSVIVISLFCSEKEEYCLGVAETANEAEEASVELKYNIKKKLGKFFAQSGWSPVSGTNESVQTLTPSAKSKYAFCEVILEMVKHCPQQVIWLSPLAKPETIPLSFSSKCGSDPTKLWVTKIAEKKAFKRVVGYSITVADSAQGASEISLQKLRIRYSAKEIDTFEVISRSLNNILQLNAVGGNKLSDKINLSRW